MNRNLALFAWLLAGLLVLNVLLNGFFVLQQMMLHRMLESTTAQINQSQMVQKETLIRNLFSDLIAYGQKQPEIFGVLKKYGVASPGQNPLPPSPSAPAPSPLMIPGAPAR